LQVFLLETEEDEQRSFQGGEAEAEKRMDRPGRNASMLG
jgi:hypothetical protein